MNKRFAISSNPTKYIKFGASMIVLANPLLYLVVGSTMIDIRNLFGASIDRQSIGFDSNDYFIQAMGVVAVAGLTLTLLGLYFRRKSS